MGSENYQRHDPRTGLMPKVEHEWGVPAPSPEPPRAEETTGGAITDEQIEQWKRMTWGHYNAPVYRMLNELSRLRSGSPNPGEPTVTELWDALEAFALARHRISAREGTIVSKYAEDAKQLTDAHARIVELFTARTAHPSPDGDTGRHHAPAQPSAAASSPDPGEAARLREALAFYADAANWQSPSTGFALQYDPEPSPVARDRGRKARASLSGSSTGGSEP